MLGSGCNGALMGIQRALCSKHSLHQEEIALDSTVVLDDFPLGLDISSLRVEGEADTKLTIGSIDAKPPRAS